MSIKFSQFNAVSSISSSGYIVGYDGANNIRIKTSTADRLFAFTGGSLQFVQLTNAMVPTNTIGIDKLVNLAGLSVLGNATNASAAMAAITAANDNEVLLRSGTSLVFSKIGTDNINNSAITFAKIQNITPQRFVGRNSSPAGPPEEVNISQALEWLSSTSNTIAYRNGSAWAALTAGTNGYVLRLSGGALGFGQIDYTSISFSATQRVLGRNTAGAGTAEELTTAQILEWLSSTQNTIAYRNNTTWTALTAGTNGHVLRLTGGALGFGQIDYSSISFTATQRILGRNTAGAGTSEEVTTAQILEWLSSTANTIAYRDGASWTTLTATSNGQVLRLTGGALGFGQIATNGIEDKAVTYGKIQDVTATARVLGRVTAGSGTVEEIVIDTDLSSVSANDDTVPSAKATKTYADTKVAKSSVPVVIQLACSDLTTAITAGTSKAYFRSPYEFTLTEVRASLLTAQTAGSIFTVDINESGTSILSTKLTIDNNEKTSVTAATPPVIGDSSIADDAEITIDVDQAGTSPAGLIVTLIGTRSI